MDVDLSTSLSALLPLVASVLSGHSDLAIGTRLARGSRVVRGPKRELISRAYSHIVRLSLRSSLTDFQCGFKAIRHERALQILPLVEDNEWFFDTELLVTAERLGVRISETPVEWTDDPNSSVDIVATATDDLRGIWRIAHRRCLQHVRAPAGHGSGRRRSHHRPTPLLRRGRRAQHAELPAAVRGRLVGARALGRQRGRSRVLHPGQHHAPPLACSALALRTGWPIHSATVRRHRRRALCRQLGRHLRRHRRRRCTHRSHADDGRRRDDRCLLRGVADPLLPPPRMGLSPDEVGRGDRDQGLMTDLMDAPAVGMPHGSTDTLDGTAPGNSPSGPIAPSGLADRCRPLLRPAGYFVASRVVVFVVALVMAAVQPHLLDARPSAPSGTDAGIS